MFEYILNVFIPLNRNVNKCLGNYGPFIPIDLLCRGYSTDYFYSIVKHNVIYDYDSIL